MFKAGTSSILSNNAYASGSIIYTRDVAKIRGQISRESSFKKKKKKGKEKVPMNDVHIHLGTAKHLLTQSVHYC
jgi:hypothetical protein